MKRPITNLVIGVAFLASFAMKLAAQPTFTVTPQTITANAGDNITVDIVVDGFTNILSFQYSMNWNASVLDYVSVTNITTQLGGFTAANFGISNTGLGQLAVSWFDPDVSGVSLPAGTVLYSLTFQVLNTNATTISFSGTPTPIEVIDGGSNSIGMTAQNASVNGGGSNPPPSGFSVIASDETVVSGSSFCLDVSVNEFVDIQSMQYSMAFDETKIEYTGLQGFNLNGLSAGNFGLNQAGNGVLTLSWLDPEVDGETLPGGTVIYQVCFNAIGANNCNVSTPFSFTNTPTPQEVTNTASEIIPFQGVNGNISICDGGGNNNPPVVGFALIAVDDTIPSGTSFCMDVNVNEFTDIVSMQYSMAFDETQLQFTGVQAFNLNGLSAGSFGTNQGGNGILTLSWLDPEVDGETLPNGTVIYQVCFDAIGPNNCAGSTLFEFTNTPTPQEVTDTTSNIVPFQGITGNIIICDSVPLPPSGGLTFTAADVTVEPGQNTCVDVSVSGFDCIVSSQFSIHFDPAIASFTGVQGFGLPGLTASNFGVANAASGTVTFSWFDQTTNGITLADSTVIFQLCFDAVGTTGQSANITFNSTPTVVEVTDCYGPGPVTPTFEPGVFTIGSNCGGAVNIGNPLITHVGCKGEATGAINITVSGGNDSYTYVWSNGATTEDLSNVAAGNYTVTVTSCGGNETQIATYTVSEPVSVINMVSQVTNETCFGQNNGAINITVTGGSFNPPGCLSYTYNWSNGSTTQDVSGLAPGSYTVTITDCNGCQLVSDAIQVAGPPSQFSAQPAAIPVKCNGGNDGSVNVTATGGVGPYQYRIVNVAPYPAWGSISIFANLPAGVYTVQSRDALSCILTTQVTVTQPDAISFLISSQDATAGNCDGEITSIVMGGTPPYNCLWSGPDNFSFSDCNPLTDLCPGTYSVTVTDANNCTATGSTFVASPLSVTFTKKNACFNSCDGSIILTSVGGIPPLQYNWSNTATTPNINNLCTGSYTVTVTSPTDGQDTIFTVNISEPGTPVSITNAVETPPTSSIDCNASVTITGVTGGFGPPYTYVWNNADTGKTATDLCDGSEYLVTVTDVNGCATVGSYIPVFILDTLESASNSASSCSGGSTGSLTVINNGGLPPFDYSIWNPVTGTLTHNNEPNSVYTFNNLAPGIYTITIVDGGTGPDQQDTTFTQEVGTVVLTIDPVQSFSATPTQNGKIKIDPQGGAIPYKFQWSNGSTAQDPTNLAPDTYDLTICDDNGCCQVFNDIAVGLLSASDDLVKPTCPDDQGSIAVIPTGGNWPYTYQWKDAGGLNIGTDSILMNQPVGTYTVVITDALGVSILKTFELTSVSNLDATVAATSDFNGFGIRCAGGNTGVAEVTPLNGVPPYSILWSSNATTETVTGLTAGTYTVEVTDMEGCKIPKTVFVTEPPDLTVTAEGERSGCGENSGLATAFPGGGVAPYTYIWDGGQPTQTAILLQGGDIQVQVTDANGCATIGTASVPTYEPLVVTGISEPDEGSKNGKAIVVVNSGTWPFTFVWKDFTVQDSVLSELFPGEYLVKVTDANDCQETLIIKVGDATQCGEVRPIITPEGDGLNEEFLIGCLSRFSDNRLEIYNRWGQLIYQMKNYNDGDLWRGTNNRGSDVPDGVYYYVFEYTDPVTGTLEVKKGSVTVLRR
jgi:gliding motility-associated-like protein